MNQIDAKKLNADMARVGADMTRAMTGHVRSLDEFGKVYGAQNLQIQQSMNSMRLSMDELRKGLNASIAAMRKARPLKVKRQDDEKLFRSMVLHFWVMGMICVVGAGFCAYAIWVKFF